MYCDTLHEGALRSFLAAMRMANDNAIYIQDDLVVCKDFAQKARKYVDMCPKHVIVFSSCFDSNNAVKNEFARLKNVSLLCTYIPKYIADIYLKAINSGEWKITEREKKLQFDDLNFSKFLWESGFDVFVAFPSLAGHLPGKSVIKKSRPIRLSANFDYNNTAWEWRLNNGGNTKA